ncbi:hypothetical protein BJX64DRAFT_293014 [Aspergillus heterothallicus]
MPKTVEPEILAKIAVIADYYDCQRLVKFYAEEWITQLNPGMAGEEHRELAVELWNAWFSKHSHNFGVYSSFIIRQAKRTIPPMGLLIPSTVIGEMPYYGG